MFQAILAMGKFICFHYHPSPHYSKTYFSSPHCLGGSTPVLPTACPTDTSTELSTQEIKPVTPFPKEPTPSPQCSMERCRMWSWCSMPFRNTELQHWDIRNSLLCPKFLLMCQMSFRPKNIFILIPSWQGATASPCKGKCERMKQARIGTLHACIPPTGSHALQLPEDQPV